MKRAIVLTLLLSACAGRSGNVSDVHLFNEYLPDPRTAEIVLALRNAGFTATVESQPMPLRIRASTLIHSSAHRAPNEIDEIRSGPASSSSSSKKAPNPP